MSSDVQAKRVTGTGSLAVGPARIRQIHVLSGSGTPRLTISDGNPIKTTKVRARNSDGTLKADDPNTPENEAWEEVPVKKRGRPKKEG